MTELIFFVHFTWTKKHQMSIKMIPTQAARIISATVRNARQKSVMKGFSIHPQQQMIFLIRRNICQTWINPPQNSAKSRRWWGKEAERARVERIHSGDNAWLPWIIKSSSLRGLSWQQHIQVHPAWTAPNCLQLEWRSVRTWRVNKFPFW